ncbi:MAG: hypothetical protein ACYC3G_02515 [Minisyncoccota bacterium]
MDEMVDWITRLTEDKKLAWHKVEGDVNEHLEEQRLKNAFMVAHSAPCVGRRFGGAYIGFRGKRKILCAAIIDGVGNWIYVDARKLKNDSVKKLLLAVKKSSFKKEDCKRCKELGWV